MSWLFGMSPSAPPPPQPPNDDSNNISSDQSAPGGSSSAPADKHKSQTFSQDSRMAYSFDSSALERAARAAKDLEKSSKT